MSLVDLLHKNIRSITELASPSMSEYLVGNGIVGVDKSKLKESAIIIRLLLIEEWYRKEGFYKLFLMLKSPDMISILLTFTSVSLRYFKVEWDESE